ncbi:MAG: flavin reductase family protein [Verrucomicrobiota bacterium]|nr:flavin reductase family protein [Verrucomicrobiota bacterium]
MNIDFDQLNPSQVYHTMTQTIIPRPIAWVLSDHGNGKYNLAPFSYFNAVCSNPPMLSLSVGLKRDGAKKDTWRNIEERSHFVVHIPRFEDMQSVLASADPLEHGESELDHCDLKLTDFEGAPLPRLEGLPIAFSCRRAQIISLGEGPQGLILGSIHRLYLEDAIAYQDGSHSAPRVSIDALDPLGRLGASEFARVHALNPGLQDT